MKTLIEIDRRIWGKVKNFATVKETSLNTAVGYLLTYALDNSGYPIQFTDQKRKRGGMSE